MAAPWAGTRDGPEGGIIPNITPDPETGIGNLKAGELEMFLSIGMYPDGNFVGDTMAEVLTHSTGKMSESDIHAMTENLQSLPSTHNVLKKMK